MNAVATEPAYTTPDGGAVYLEPLEPLRGIGFYHVRLYDDDGVLVAEFPSMGEGHIASMAARLCWKLVP